MPFSFHLKQPACNLIDGILQLRGFVRRPMFAAADVLPINKIAFEAEGFLHGQECEAENISFGRENLFQQYKVRRILERGGKGKAASNRSYHGISHVCLLCPQKWPRNTAF